MAWALHSEVVHQDLQGDVVALLVEPRANLPQVRKECAIGKLGVLHNRV